MNTRLRGRPARHLGRIPIFGLLLVLLTASLVFAAGHWGLGNYQFVNGPSSGPLQARMTGSGSLRSYSFVGGVGGVAFAVTAKPGPTLAGKPIRLTYDRSKPDGSRLGIELGGTTHFQDLPDWVLIPVARYADSEFNACVSLFGPQTTNTQYDLVYHQAFEDTLLGMRLLQADILFFDLRAMWQLPRLDGRTVLGTGEREPEGPDLKAQMELNSALQGGQFQSWVLTDEGETIGVGLKEGKLQFTGLPYYHFWISDFASYNREIGRLKQQANRLLAAGDLAGHNRVVQQANLLEPQVHAVATLTSAVKKRREMIRRYNPAVYEVATNTMHYAAFFRYVQESAPTSWNAFLASLQGVAPRPKVETPVRWARGR
jgi:hypothetical protein